MDKKQTITTERKIGKITYLVQALPSEKATDTIHKKIEKLIVKDLQKKPAAPETHSDNLIEKTKMYAAPREVVAFPGRKMVYLNHGGTAGARPFGPAEVPVPPGVL